MMKVLAAILYFAAAVLAVAQDDLTKAKDAIKSGQYDAAIQSLQKFTTTNSRSAEGHTLLAEAYRLKGELPNAQAAIERAIDLDDEYEPALASGIRIYGKIGLWDKVQKTYDLAVKYHKNGIAAPLAYAQMYLELDSLDKASAFFSTVKALDENNVDAYAGLAEVYARQNVLVMAIENYRTATRLNPNDPALWYRLATTILKNRVLNADQIKEIMNALQKSMDLDPDNARAVFDAANILFRIKKWQEAAGFFKRYTEKVKDNAEAWEKLGVSAYNAPSYIDAIPALEKAIAMNPKKFELKPMLGHSYYGVKEWKKAVDFYNSLPKDSLRVDDLYRLGFSYFQLKDTVNAITFLDQTIAKDSGHTDAVGTLAAIQLNRKNYDKAVALYSLYLNEEPNNITALFYYSFGCYVLNHYDSAKAGFNKLVALRPNNMQSHQYLGQIYSFQDSCEQAGVHAKILISLADSAIKADKNEAKKVASNSQLAISGYRLLALCDYKAKDIKGSIGNLEKAVEYEKGKMDEGLHLFLAQMYAVYSGDQTLLAKEAKEIRAKACQEYAKVLKINPKNEAAKKESAQMNCGK